MNNLHLETSNFEEMTLEEKKMANGGYIQALVAAAVVYFWTETTTNPVSSFNSFQKGWIDGAAAAKH